MEPRLLGPKYEDVVECLREPIKAGKVDRLWHVFPETRVKTEDPEVVDILKSGFGKDVFTVDGEPFASVVGATLRQAGLTLATAESCTGGLAGDMLTDIPGSSDYYLLGVVSYSNLAKQRVLGVESDALREHGAVSEPVVRQMLAGVLALSGADCGIAVSGIAGPGGGSPAKPVGTVFIAAGCGARVDVRRFNFGADRRGNKLLSAYTALDMVRKMI